ncbi:hypothetical protein GCM10007907_04680 [Chitinimonas prasina]|uniref:CheW-like domain-containing protein n=1 Tax=Chitinimonas prasina TaxID=1434937 RepID=A0ABQ5YDJ1_9NEIS|nr:chemotaxis protein CheW [Chitinimonas prasina]GLR11678.1 hypothetical protein GCM10007907_04680 [Chitinimonas prasina]
MNMMASDHWSALHRQLDALAEQLQRSDTQTPEQQADALAARSLQWAQSPGAACDATQEVLAFTLGDEIYALALPHIDAVIPLKQLTPLPGTPPFVRGIVNARGRVVSVLDLRVLFALPPRGLADRNHLVILRNTAMEFGLLADRILGVQMLAPNTLQTEQAGLSGLRRNLLQGISPQQWQVLDGDRLLNEPSLVVDDYD